MQTVSVRLSAEEIKKIQALSKQGKKEKSAIESPLEHEDYLESLDALRKIE